MATTAWKPGDWAVYLKQKRSRSPGPRAKEIYPATAGDTYSYVVEKYWVVDEVLDDGTVRLRTRRGKEHLVPPGDVRLRRPRWWERLLLAHRFRAVESTRQAPQSERRQDES